MDLKSQEFVQVELTDGVAELRITRPKALNALNAQVLSELERVLQELGAIASLRCLILTGAGDRAFVAGADIEAMSKMSPEEARAFAAQGHRITSLLEDFPVPVLAAVNGYALGGGCELALACDIIYAAENAKLGQPEVKLGLIPGFGGAVRLPRKVGLAAASEWIYTGEIISAQSAQALGLVREVLSQEDLLPRVREVAKVIAQRAPLAVRAAKKVLARGMRLTQDEAAALEQEEFAALFATEDMREGTRAFVEKREAEFRGE